MQGFHHTALYRTTSGMAKWDNFIFIFLFYLFLQSLADTIYIEITSWKARAYRIFTRVGEVSEIERVSAVNE